MSKKSSSARAELCLPDTPYLFDARLFNAVARFRAIRDIRFYPCGVYLMPCTNGGAMAIATDGQQAAIAWDPDGRAPDARIVTVTRSAESASRARSAKYVGVDSRLIVFDAAMREMFVQPGSATIEGGKFPNVFGGNIFPPPGAALVRGNGGAILNSKLIERLAAVGVFLGKSRSMTCVGLTHWAKDDTSVLITRYEAEANFAVATMPMLNRGPRDESLLSHCPSFLRGHVKDIPTAPAPQPSDAAPVEA